MSKILKRELSVDMGPAVLGYLGHMAKLPDRGIVAGQAVASALFDLYGDGIRRGPINDIDIFTLNEQKEKTLRMGFATKQSFATGSTMSMYMKSDQDGSHKIHDESYKVFNMPAMTSRRILDITSVSNDGLLNFVGLNPAYRALGNFALNGPATQNDKQRVDVTPAAVLSSFDLNCVEVAVDIQSQKLHWNKGFEYFCNTTQLQVSNIHGEAHTYVRMLKKLKEMPWMYCDEPSTLLALSLSSHIKSIFDENLKTQTAMRIKEYGMSPEDIKKMERMANTAFLGKKYMDRVEQFKGRFADGFAISVHSPKQGLYRATPQIQLADPRLNAFGDVMNVVRMSKEIMDEGEMLSTANQGYLQNAMSWAIHSGPSTAYRIGLVNGAAQKKRMDRYLRAAELNFSEKKDFLSTEADHAGFARLMLNLHKDAYLTGQVDPNEIQRLHKFLSDHTPLKTMFSSFVLDEQLSLMSTIKKLDSESDGVFIGVLESTISGVTPIGLCISKADVLDTQTLAAVYKPLIEQLKLPIEVQPLPVLPEIEGVRVKELLTPIQLKLEGSRMRHCVGGYAQKVASNTSRIISITSGKASNEASTLELHLKSFMFKDQNIHYPRIQQHRGFANGRLPAGHKEAENAIVMGLFNTLNPSLPLLSSGEVKSSDIHTKQLSDYKVTASIKGVVDADLENMPALVEAMLESDLIPFSEGFGVLEKTQNSETQQRAGDETMELDPYPNDRKKGKKESPQAIAILEITASDALGKEVAKIRYPVSVNQNGTVDFPEIPYSLVSQTYAGTLRYVWGFSMHQDSTSFASKFSRFEDTLSENQRKILCKNMDEFWKTSSHIRFDVEQSKPDMTPAVIDGVDHASSYYSKIRDYAKKAMDYMSSANQGETNQQRRAP